MVKEAARRPARRVTRGARTLAQYDAYRAIVQAAGEMEREFAELLKESDFSSAQYNVLRILRGAGSGGLACREIAARMIQFDPDITRLLDRLERRELIERARDAQDRRIVRTRITTAGLEVLDALDEPIDALHERQLGHLSERQLRDLRALVEAARARPG